MYIRTLTLNSCLIRACLGLVCGKSSQISTQQRAAANPPFCPSSTTSMKIYIYLLNQLYLQPKQCAATMKCYKTSTRDCLRPLHVVERLSEHEHVMLVNIMAVKGRQQ